MAGGAANTNGSGSDPCGTVPLDDGMNARSIAIEAGNSGGTGEPWPQVQQDCYRWLVAALCAAYGIGVAQAHSHFEWAPGRKIDPAGQSRYASGSAMWDMDAFRADVASLISTPEPEPEPTPEPGTDPEPEGDTVKLYLVRDPRDRRLLPDRHRDVLNAHVDNQAVADDGIRSFGWIAQPQGGPWELSGAWESMLDRLPSVQA